MKKVTLGLFTLVLIVVWRAVSCAATYERVISLSPAITEIIYALGAEARLVGVSSYCNYPPAAQDKTDMGGFINPNLERIIVAKPDVVILSPNSGTKMIQESLARLGIKNEVVSFYTIDHLRKAYAQIGTLVGAEKKAAQLQRELAATIETIHAKTAGVTKPSMVFVREHSPLYVSGKGTYEDDLITIIGGTNSVSRRTGALSAVYD